MNKQALLLSGGVNYRCNYIRYVNDLELAYMVLKYKEFSDNNIEALYGNGLKSLNLGRGKTQAATKENLREYMKRAEEYLTEDDEFVMVVSNHGGDEGIIYLWGEGVYIEHDELALCLNKIRAKKIIVLGECYAGDFLKYDIENSCIFTANAAGMPSFAHVNNQNELDRKKFTYDEFLYHFFSFLLEKYPDTGNRVPEGGNDLRAAYEYAKANDIFNPSNRKNKRLRNETREKYMEIPQMKNNLKEKIISL